MKRTIVAILFGSIICTGCVSTQGAPTQQASIQKQGPLPAEPLLQLGHSQPISAIALSPDERHILSCSSDGQVILWATQSGVQIRSWNDLQGIPNDVAFNSDGKVVLASVDDRVIAWEAETGRRVRTFQLPKKRKRDGLYELAVSPDGKHLLAGCTDQRVKVWDFRSGKLLQNLRGHKGTIKPVAFSPDGHLVASGARDASIRLWKFPGGHYLRTLKIPVWKNAREGAPSIEALAFSPDGKRMAATSYDEKIHVWEVMTGKYERTIDLKGKSGLVGNVVFSPDGSRLVAALGDKGIGMWDVKTGGFIDGIQGTARGVLFIADGQKIVSHGKYANDQLENDLKILDISSKKVLRTFQRNVDPSRVAAFFPDGRRIFTTAGAYWHLWDLDSGREINSGRGDREEILAAVMLPDGHHIVTGGKGGRVEIRNLNNGRETATYEFPGEWVQSLAVSSDGRHLAAGGMNNYVLVWNLQTGRLVQKLKVWRTAKYCRVTSITFSPDGQHLLAGGNWNGLGLYALGSGREVGHYRHDHESGAAAYSADGSLIATGDSSGKVSLWNASTNQKIRDLEGIKAPVTALALTPGSRFVIAGFGRSVVRPKANLIRVWDAASGRVVYDFSSHKGRLQSLDVSADGRRLLSAAEDGTVRLWDLQAGKEIAMLVSYPKGEWLIYTPEGYFTASPDAGSRFHMVQGLKVFGIDQFSLVLNRPDRILESLGSSNQAYIRHLHSRHLKRLARHGLPADLGLADYHTPDIQIVDFKQDGRSGQITFNMQDSRYPLTGYNIYINDVPLFGAMGKPLQGRGMHVSETITLTKGDNKIEVACRNTQGTESYRALTRAYYAGKNLGDLYYIGFGVSKYRNPQLNLAYADKDARDLAGSFGAMAGRRFKKVHTHLFLNEDVSVANIEKARQRLASATEDDTVVLFIAGHGLHDSDDAATYYYLTHATDLANLAGTAATFEQIENLLQNIKPRQKLFLMDTCDSGELEEDGPAPSVAVAQNPSMVARTTRAVKVLESSQGSLQRKARRYLHNKNRYIYNDLFRRSGAIVISSSRGGEASWEDPRYENGCFTEEILRALSGRGGADLNGDALVSTDELKNHVMTAVPKLTQDRQHPTVDRDNIYQKFEFPVVVE